IMMIIPWMVMGGADLFNLEVLKKINKEKYEVSILTTVHSDNVWKSKFREYTDEIYELPSFLDIRNYPEFISYFIQSRDIDILFLSNSYYGYHLIPWIRKEFPGLAIIDYVHMEEWYWRNGGYGRTSGMMGEILEKTYVCNEGTRKVLIDHFHRKAEDVKTLYIGVDQDKYDESKVEEGVVREKYGLGNRPIVLFPCRIHPQKRPFLMLEIAKGVKKRKKDIAFLVVGDGPQLEEMKLKSKSLGLEENVYFAGRQEDMMPYYKDATLTLICSLKEGLALTAYESVSMKTPVVSADVGGQKELIDSTVGRIIPLYQKEGEELDKREFPREEIEEYVAAITDLISDKGLYEEMRENCRKRIRERFSTQIMIEELEKELEQSKAEERVAKRKRVSG
ncbi:glycosyltransferase family 4 protein, partial [Filifactor villosus]